MANSAKEILISVAVNQHDKHQRDAWLRKKSGTRPRGLLLRLDHVIDRPRRAWRKDSSA